jgi:periplasmic protein TonB
MPGTFESVPPRERYTALAAAAVVQLGIGLALLSGLHVSVGRMKDTAQQLIEVALPQPPKPPPPKPKTEKRLPRPKPQAQVESAPQTAPAPLGGSPGTDRAIESPAVVAIIPVRPAVAAPGGGTGTGPAVGSGAGGGTGGAGTGSGGGGDGGGGTELEQIGGDIFPRDYPRRLGNAGIGGQVGVIFVVTVNGRAERCRIRRSSGIAELDQLTCRLIEQRFRFRPSTDRFGRPIADEVEYDHEWTVNRR